jgi:hypothetical protein
VLAFTEQFPEVPTVREFQRLRPMGPQWVEQELFGSMPWLL